MRINEHSKRGFTVVELLVVVAVIAILATLTILAYSGIAARAIDASVVSDAENMNSAQIMYKLSHASQAKAYFSGNGPDAELQFTPTGANVVDVVVDGKDYVIRAYNTAGTKNSIFNAYTKESRSGIASELPPSNAVLSIAIASVPTAPTTTVSLDGSNILAAIGPETCAVGTIQYGINSRINDGAWTGFTAWSDALTAIQPVNEGVKYGYQARARCYVTETTFGEPSVGAEATYTQLFAPAAPTVTVVQVGDDIQATINPVTCLSGTVQYALNSRVDSGEWTGYTAWSATTTATQAATGSEGVKYSYQAEARCFTSDIELSPTATGAEGSYISPILPPVPPTVTAATTAGDSTTYSWGAMSCAIGATVRYQYRLTVAPSGFDSGWAATTNLSATFATSTGDQTYTLQTQAQCYNANTTSEWSGSGSASYYCVYDALPIASSISGYWAAAPFGYLLEDGTAVSRTTYADLFAVIGTTYGAGDGSTTFNLPDSRGRVAVNKSPTDTEFDVMGEKYGEKVHTLTGAESGLVGHNHLQNAHNHSKVYNFTNSFPGGQDRPLYYGTNGASLATVWYDNATATNIAASAANASSPHNTIQPSIVKVSAIKYRPATASDSTLAAATSVAGYFTSAPAGYLLQDGSAVSRATYPDLFAAIGTTYGAGDGSTTFNLPDSRGRTAVNQNPADVEFDTLGEKYGEKAHTNTIAESGEKGHNHTQNPHSHSKVYNFASSFPGGQDRPLYYGTNGASLATVWTDNTTATNQAVASANATSAHNTVQPSIVKLFVIKYTPAIESIDVAPKGTSISGYFTAAPAGYLLEDGSEVSRDTYADLFAVIGTTYGAGDGLTTFNLPDSRGRVTVNKSPTDTEFDTIGEKYGTKIHLITGSESGEKGHNHIQDAHNHSRTHNFAGSFPGGQDRPLYYGTNGASLATVGTDNATATNQAVGASNASASHNNIQPSIVQNFAIRY